LFTKTYDSAGENDVAKFHKYGLIALAVAAATMSSASAARAWGCIAVSEEGSYGYSYNYDNESDASERALNECANKTTTESVCEITECNEDT
jgi:Domain of unknown function (DUF4189)